MNKASKVAVSTIFAPLSLLLFTSPINARPTMDDVIKMENYS